MTPDKRRKMLAALHARKKELGLSEEDYRARLKQGTGRESAAQLSEAGLKKALEVLKTAPARPGGFYRIPAGYAGEAQKRYIAALWSALGYKPQGLNARIKKQFGVESLIWLRDQEQLQTLAKDLWNRCVRKGINPDAAGR